MGRKRNAFLRALVRDEVMPVLGRADGDEIIEYMLARGDVTTDELANSYGRVGFKREVIQPVWKEAGADGLDRFPPTPDGKHQQLQLFDDDELVWLYKHRKEHRDDCTTSLEKLRLYIIDRCGIDPE